MKIRRTTCCGSVVAILALLVGTVPARASISCRLELDRDLLVAAKGEKAIVKVTLDGERPSPSGERPSVNLSIVLDRSGSMSGTKLEKAKEAAIEALRRLRKGDMFSLVIYDHSVETLVAAQDAANAEWIESRIRSIGPGGNTALFGGVSQGAAEIRKNLEGNYVHRVILLSDGLANVGPSSPADLGRLGKALMKEGISVTTVGVGTDYNEDVMAQLAQGSDGNTYFVENSRDLARIFNEELGDVLSIVARKVRITIECPDGVTPVKIIGRDGRVKGQTVDIGLNQLYGGQAKYVLVEVTLPASVKPGQTLEIASARVEYEDALTSRRENCGGRVAGTFTADRQQSDASFNVPVVKAYAINNVAIAQELALDNADAGDIQAAVQVLQAQAAEVKQIAEQTGDVEVQAQYEQLERDANDLQNDGLNKVNRKDIRSRAFQFKNQQRFKGQ